MKLFKKFNEKKDKKQSDSPIIKNSPSENSENFEKSNSSLTLEKQDSGNSLKSEINIPIEILKTNEKKLETRIEKKKQILSSGDVNKINKK
jgi:hypothetical protein